MVTSGTHSSVPRHCAAPSSVPRATESPMPRSPGFQPPSGGAGQPPGPTRGSGHPQPTRTPRAHPGEAAPAPGAQSGGAGGCRGCHLPGSSGPGPPVTTGCCHHSLKGHSPALAEHFSYPKHPQEEISALPAPKSPVTAGKCPFAFTVPVPRGRALPCPQITQIFSRCQQLQGLCWCWVRAQG